MPDRTLRDHWRIGVDIPAYGSILRLHGRVSVSGGGCRHLSPADRRLLRAQLASPGTNIFLSRCVVRAAIMSRQNMEKLLSEIPDAIFDFYCRFIPGAYVLALIYLLSDEKPLDKLPICDLSLAAFVAAFTIGHVLQPPSSAIARFFSSAIDSDGKLSGIYKKAKLDSPDGSRLLRLVSKAYSEAVSMAALAIGSALVNLYFMAASVKDSHAQFLWGSFAVFLLMCGERLRARARKIRDLKETA